jgi:MFS family permease
MGARRLAKFSGASLWSHRDFRLYWGASTVSAFGSTVTRIALPLVAIYELDASPFAVGLIAFAEEAPLLVLGLAAGIWIDRRRRLPIMLATDVLRALVLLLVPLAWALDRLSLALLVAVALTVGTLSVAFDIAGQAMMSTLLPPEQYVEGNGKRYAAEAAAQVGGPGLGGVLVRVAGAAPSILFDAATYIASFAFLRRMHFVEPPPVAAAAESLRQALKAGLSEIGRNPYLRPVTLATSSLTFVSGIGLAMLIPYAAVELDLGSTSIGLGFSLSGVGALLGSFLAPPVAKRLGLGRALILGLGLAVPGLLVMALAAGPPVVAGLMLTGGLFLTFLTVPVYDINQFSLRQAVTPERLRGRVVAAARVSIRGAAALGALTGGVIADLAGLRTAMLVAAAAPVCAIVVLWGSPVLAHSAMPAPSAALASK